MTPEGRVLNDPGFEAATRLLTELRDEVTRADAKATVLLGALGMTAGLLTALLSGRRWSPSLLSAAGSLLWWAGALALVGTLLAALLAVAPRYRRSCWQPGHPLTYFGDIRRAARTGELATALTETGRDPVGALLPAVAEVSRIAARKHLWIRSGLITFCCAVALLLGSLLVP